MKFSPTGPISLEQTQAKIADCIESYERLGVGKWAVILRETSQLIGYCGIAVETIDNQPEYEIGYRFAPDYWSQGLATEAAKEAIAYGFESLDLPYILGIVDPINLASVRVLEKLGMTYNRTTIFAELEMHVYALEKP